MTFQSTTTRTSQPAIIASLVLSLLGLVDSIFNYFWTGNGIHGTEGALLVVISTLLLVLAIGVLVARWGPGWLHVVLEVLIVLDFIGTGLAAYLLNAWILLALMVLALVAWLIHAIRPSPRPSTLG